MLANNIFTTTNLTFQQQAIATFTYQYQHNILYQQYVDALHINIDKVNTIEDIPFLPIQFFKNKKITTTAFEPEQIFTSSGTTGYTTSSHYIKELSIYQTSYTKAFEQFYGSITQYCVIGLLPSYLERTGSSLVYMVNDFIVKSNHPLSDFYLNEYEHLYLMLQQLEYDKQPTILFGVTFALLDFAVLYKMNLEHVTIIETGGMKGRGTEYTRQQIHELLKARLGCSIIHSEYGMTELLSQAYTNQTGLFATPPWMKVLVRQADNPLQVNLTGKGVLNIIDLAKIYSCSFIATDDIGIIYQNKNFEVQGRLDTSDTRGCSLLTA